MLVGREESGQLIDSHPQLRTVEVMSTTDVSESREELLAAAHRFMDDNDLSEGTLAQYRKVWEHRFVPWCAEGGIDPLDEEQCAEDTVAAYLVDRHEGWFSEADGSEKAAVCASTLDGELAAIAHMCGILGRKDPTRPYPRQVLAGMRRSEERRPGEGPQALTADLAEEVCRLDPSTGTSRAAAVAALILGHRYEIPVAQLIAMETADVGRSGGGFFLDLPETRYGLGGKKTAPARRVEVVHTADGELCPASSLDRLLAVTGDRRRLFADAFPSPTGQNSGLLRYVLSRAAAQARVHLELAPYPGAGMSDGDLARLVMFLDPEALRFYRDQLYSVFGHCGAFRGDELGRLRGTHIDSLPEGLIVYLATSKGDQMRSGQVVYIPVSPDPRVCPVRLLRRWQHLAGIGETELIFPHMHHLSLVRDQGMDTAEGRKAVRRITARLGLEGVWGTRSLRRGFCTSAANARENLVKIAAAARHRSLGTTRRYIAQVAVTDRPAPNALRELGQ